MKNTLPIRYIDASKHIVEIEQHRAILATEQDKVKPDILGSGKMGKVHDLWIEWYLKDNPDDLPEQREQEWRAMINEIRTEEENREDGIRDLMQDGETRENAEEIYDYIPDYVEEDPENTYNDRLRDMYFLFVEQVEDGGL